MRVRSAIVLAGLAAVVAVPMAAAAPNAPAGVLVIDTFAGTGERGESGDGGQATKAKLNHPSAIAIDGAGNIYFSQQGAPNSFRDTIRKIDTKGVISTVLGTGDQLPTKEGIAADKADLGDVRGLAADKAGNLSVMSESERNGLLTVELYQVYRAEAGPMIRMIAGGGTVEPGKATKGLEANLSEAWGVGAAAAGGVYVLTSRRAIKVDPVTTDVTVIAGNGEATSGAPLDGKDATQVPIWAISAIAEDQAGNVYLGGADDLLLVTKKDGKIWDVACRGDVPAADGVEAKKSKCDVEKVAVSPAGAVFFTVMYDRVLTIDADKKIKRVAGGPGTGYGGDGGKAADAKLSSPYDLEFDAAGNLYVADWGNHRIRKISLQAAPVAKDDSVKIDPGKEAKGDVLANDTGTKLTVTAHTEPKNGTATLPADGKFGYRPKDGFTGEDSFTYTVTDSVGQTATAKVTITVGTAGGGGTPTTPTTQPPAPQGSNNPATGGGLASTGASVIGLTAAAIALLGVGGGLIAFTARRRRTRRAG